MWESHETTRFGGVFFTLGEFSSKLYFLSSSLQERSLCINYYDTWEGEMGFSRTSWAESSWLKTALGSTATDLTSLLSDNVSYILKSTEAYAEDESAPRYNWSQRAASVSTEGYYKEHETELFAEQTWAIKAKFTATCSCQFQMSKQPPSSNRPKQLKQDVSICSANATCLCPTVQPKLLPKAAGPGAHTCYWV